MKSRKLFLTSWPHGELKPVEVIGKHRTIKNGWYIRYEDGGTETTTPDFLFDIPVNVNIKDYNATINARNFEIERLENGIKETLIKNAHLADGDDCTLLLLKQLVGVI